jgi:RNA polymerase sigma-70 factor (ECF subfamily)
MHAILSQGVPIEQGEQVYKALARQDRRRAMDLVVRDFRGRLFQHALFIVKDSPEAYDAVQEVFIKAMREPRFFDAEFRMKAWLFRVTSNLCYNIVRDRRRRGGILESLGRRDLTHASQLGTVQSTERRDEVLALMDRLGEHHKEILQLRYYDDLSYAEIADVLGVKLGTVMSRLSRARTRLGELLGPNHPVVLEVLGSDGQD